MSTTQTTQPDLAAVKQRQQKMWASGDYSAVAARIAVMAEDMVQAAGLKAGERVLDVATGSGNAAIAAARCGCVVTGTDYVPELLERGRARAAAEGLEVWFAEADAEDLPYRDGEFDAVLSSLGVMFAPDQERRHPRDVGLEGQHLEVEHQLHVFGEVLRDISGTDRQIER